MRGRALVMQCDSCRRVRGRSAFGRCEGVLDSVCRSCRNEERGGQQRSKQEREFRRRARIARLSNSLGRIQRQIALLQRDEAITAARLHVVRQTVQP